MSIIFLDEQSSQREYHLQQLQSHQYLQKQQMLQRQHQQQQLQRQHQHYQGTDHSSRTNGYSRGRVETKILSRRKCCT